MYTPLDRIRSITLRSSQFWGFTQLISVVSYRCFRTTYRVPPSEAKQSNLRCVKSQKCEDLTYIAVKAWN